MSLKGNIWQPLVHPNHSSGMKGQDLVQKAREQINMEQISEM